MALNHEETTGNLSKHAVKSGDCIKLDKHVDAQIAALADTAEIALMKRVIKSTQGRLNELRKLSKDAKDCNRGRPRPRSQSEPGSCSIASAEREDAFVTCREPPDPKSKQSKESLNDSAVNLCSSCRSSLSLRSVVADADPSLALERRPESRQRRTSLPANHNPGPLSLPTTSIVQAPGNAIAHQTCYCLDCVNRRRSVPHAVTTGAVRELPTMPQQPLIDSGLPPGCQPVLHQPVHWSHHGSVTSFDQQQPQQRHVLSPNVRYSQPEMPVPVRNFSRPSLRSGTQRHSYSSQPPSSNRDRRHAHIMPGQDWRPHLLYNDEFTEALPLSWLPNQRPQQQIAPPPVYRHGAHSGGSRSANRYSAPSGTFGVPPHYNFTIDEGHEPEGIRNSSLIGQVISFPHHGNAVRPTVEQRERPRPAVLQLTAEQISDLHNATLQRMEKGITR